MSQLAHNGRNLSHDILLRQLKLGAEDRPFVVVGVLRTDGPTAIKTGNKAIILSDGSIEGWVGGHCTENEIVTNAISCLEDGVPRSLNLTTCQGGRMDVYLEPYLPKRKLIVIGHVPIVEALSRLARSLNFTVAVVDKIATKENFPSADVISGSIDELKKKWKIDSRETFVVVATMGENDQGFVDELLKLGVQYIGVVAGKRRASEVLSYLRASGFSEEDISRIRSPAGIYIRAVTSEEIALSIMAEIIEFARTGRSSSIGIRESQMSKTHSDTSRNPTNSSEASVAIDPVCGMTVDTESPEFVSNFEGKKLYFCSESCKNSFDADPQKYALEQSSQ